MQRLYPNGEFPEYQAKVDEVFADDPLVGLVQSLRNILLHDEAAPLVFHGIMGDFGDATNELGLDVASLLRHKKLSSNVKRYLRAAGKVVDIPVLIREYDQRVRGFYDWFGQQQRLHAEELARRLWRVRFRMA